MTEMMNAFQGCFHCDHTCRRFMRGSGKFRQWVGGGSRQSFFITKTNQYTNKSGSSFAGWVVLLFLQGFGPIFLRKPIAL